MGTGLNQKKFPDVTELGCEGDPIRIVGEGAWHGEVKHTTLWYITMRWIVVVDSEGQVYRYRFSDCRPVGTPSNLLPMGYTFRHVDYRDMRAIQKALDSEKLIEYRDVEVPRADGTTKVITRASVDVKKLDRFRVWPVSGRMKRGEGS